MEERVGLRVVVRGLVQGVSFRYFVVREARSRGVTGYVCNLPDYRSLETVAEGPREALMQLLERLKQGPPSSRVEHVETQWLEAAGACQDFDVLYWESVEGVWLGATPSFQGPLPKRGVFSNYRVSAKGNSPGRP